MLLLISLCLAAGAVAVPYAPPLRNPGSSSCPNADSNGVYPSIQEQYRVYWSLADGHLNILQLSSNQTLAPFSTPAITIEQLSVPAKQPSVPAVCDASRRCIEGFELTADITTLDLGFRDLATGKPLLSHLLTYDGQFLGPAFKVQQGVQSLVRLHNNINCDTSADPPVPINAKGTYYEKVTALAMHRHGAASLSPFDGLPLDNIRPCEWKDYVYDNSGFMEANWYHDHANGITSFTVPSGLAGTWLVKPCNMNDLPQQLRALYPPQWLSFSDNTFWLEPWNDSFMSPRLGTGRPINITVGNKTVSSSSAGGDHIFTNGKPWPVVKVQRKSYFFIVHNAAQARGFHLVLTDGATGANLMNSSVFWIVGSDGGLRAAPVQAPEILALGVGERYQVVIDFSGFAPGTQLVLTNPPEVKDDIQFCYTHLIMKFVVDGTEPRAHPFDPKYVHDSHADGAQQDMGTEQSAQAACELAMNGGADVKVQTQVLPGGYSVLASAVDVKPTWTVAMVGNTSSLQFGRRSHSRRALRGSSRAVKGAGSASSSQAARRGLRASFADVSEYLPQALPTNGWTTWYVYNNATVNLPDLAHIIHLHQIKLYLCGRRNNVTGRVAQPYELLTPKDLFYYFPFDEVAFITRSGPHGGNYDFHCHNLIHEDGGMMGVFNITSVGHPRGQTFWKGTQDAERFKGSTADFTNLSDDPLYFAGEDPLVSSDPSDPTIGHDLYNQLSMPPRRMRTDPANPGKPQPLDRKLLLAVLKRNYYAAFYPDGRTSLSHPVAGNPYAVVCPVHNIFTHINN